MSRTLADPNMTLLKTYVPLCETKNENVRFGLQAAGVVSRSLRKTDISRDPPVNSLDFN